MLLLVQGHCYITSSNKAVGRGIDDLTSEVARALARGSRVALGFDCPTWFPVGEKPWERKPRSWDEPTIWPALADGIHAMAWILEKVVADYPRDETSHLGATTQREKWDKERPLLLWEARFAPDLAAADAATRLHAGLRGFLGVGKSPVDEAGVRPFNLFVAAGPWADRLELSRDEAHYVPYTVTASSGEPGSGGTASANPQA